MTTFYLDYENGDDTKDGLTYANRWKSIAGGATAARIAPGDPIRIKGTPTPTSLGINATWNQNSKTVTLASSLTQLVSNCDVAWTASANVTATASATRKEGTNSASIAVAAAFTTGLAAYRATGLLDLSAYKQISFWIQNNAAVITSELSLRLCSDTVGAVSVTTITIPPIASINRWVPITIDTGAALPVVVNSIALYVDSDQGAVTVLLDDIIACKDSTAADSLSLTSLIGKVWNLSWAASTTYASNDIRRPTQPNRNSFCYQVTAGGGGSSGSSEPTWPLDVGQTVIDGALTWTCLRLEDTWYPIQSINGTTVLIDNGTATLANAGRGYDGTTETVLTYKRETVKLAIITSAGTASESIQDSGTAASHIIFSGGWNRTDMSTQTEETWLDLQSGFGNLYAFNTQTNIQLVNLNGVRGNIGARIDNASAAFIGLTSCHFVAMTADGITVNGTSALLNMIGCNSSNNTGGGVALNDSQSIVTGKRNRFSNNLTAGSTTNNNLSRAITYNYIMARNNGSYGINPGGGNTQTPIIIRNGVFSNNATADMFPPTGKNEIRCLNCLFGSSTEFAASTAFADQYIYSIKHDQTADNHLITTDGGTIVSTTDQREVASGISWKFRPTSTNRSADYPLKLSLGKIAIKTNQPVTISVWTYRDNTNIQGQLIVPGGQVAGVGEDVTVSCAPSINTGTRSSNLTFTPTEKGVVEIFFYVWDGVGTTNNFWIDGLRIS